MACSKEINNGDANKIVSCLSDTDELIVLRKVSGVYQPFRTTYAQFKSCIVAPPSVHFVVDDPANQDNANINYPLGGGTTFFSSALIGRRSVIVMVNNNILPQRSIQPDYCTPNFSTGEIVRPLGFQEDDYVEIYFL